MWYLFSGSVSMKFTEATVRAFVAPADKADHYEWDDSIPGFGFRCQSGGRKSYLIKYRVGDRQRKLTLGATNKVTLDAARTNAKASFAKVAMGIDPANERAGAVADAAKTFDPIIDDYLATLQAKVNTGKLTSKHHKAMSRFLKHYFKALHGLPITGEHRIKLADVAKELNRIEIENGPIAMNRARTSLSGFFNWAIGEGLCEINPVTNARVNDQESRDRVLENSELRSIWHGLPDNDYGKICKLLILTCQRRGEIGELPVKEFNRAERKLEFAGPRTKNGLPHDVPLSDPAMAILESIDMEGREFVFGRHLAAPFSGWSKAKAELDLEANIDDWILHDFRRTGGTRMNENGIAPHIVEAVLNHVSSEKSGKKGVSGTYNKAKYIKEKREALDTLASFVMGVVA
jgi:integrase